MKSSLLVKDLMPLEDYAREHEAFRAEVIAHRADRLVRIGRNATLLFEDEMTVRYQIQEALRIEEISDEAAIQAEIDLYAPRIPDGSNLKASFMLEFSDSRERQATLGKLSGIENRVWMQVNGAERVFGVVNAAAPEADEETSALHFLRFDLGKPMLRELKQGSSLSLGIDHPGCSASLVLSTEVRRSLVKDLR